MPQLSTNPVLLWDSFFQVWQPTLIPSLLWGSVLWAEHGNLLSNIRGRNSSQLHCAELCTQQKKVTQALPLQEQAWENTGPSCAGWNIPGSRVVVPCWSHSMSNCRHWGWSRAAPEEQKGSWGWNFIFWKRLVGGGLGKLNTICLGFQVSG